MMKRFEPLSEPTTPRKARLALVAAFEALEQAARDVGRAPGVHHIERFIASSMWRGWLAAQLTEGDEGGWILSLYVGAELRMVWAVEPPPAGEERGWRMGQGDDEAHLPVEMERLVAARLALWPPPESIAIIEGRHMP